jgi:release factor glutamine methyltransferase
MMKYEELYQWGRSRLQQAGIEEAALDARLLLEHICCTDRNTLLAHGDRPVTAEEEKNYREAVALRETHVPLQHITGVQEFMGLEFLVNEHVLIPRQDTEILVEEVMRYMQDGDRILDMCTGSGCILLSLLHYSNYCTGIGADISQEALETARENEARIRKLDRPAAWEENKAEFIRSDLFSGITPEKFDLIVSNPPYIASGEIGTLMEEVRDHEPRAALDGKEDGLFFYRRIAKEGKDYLKREGMLFFEIGCDQAEAVSRIMEENGYNEVTVVKDFAGLDRVVCGSLYG